MIGQFVIKRVGEKWEKFIVKDSAGNNQHWLRTVSTTIEGLIQ